MTKEQMTPRSVTCEPGSTSRLIAATLLVAAVLAATCASPGVAHAATAPAYPRVAIWWPDPDEQAPADLAGCDWIALQSQDAHHIAQLRSLNPSLIVLGSTSSREVNYDLNDYGHPANVELRTVSTDWMLTQVGTTLAAGVTTSTTTIPVKDISKFAVGEMVLVGHELMHIEAIGSSGLTVMARGRVNPPSSHPAGTRVASVVSHWPRSIAMDLSGDCPARDVGYGPETWCDWNVRRGIASLRSADWDGLLIDGLEGDLHWMVTIGDVRSIDPLRTNKPVTDGYAAFDAAWQTGATAYGSALRAAAGSKILIGNGNLRNYDLNGNIFEEYPYPTLSLKNWNMVFFGPYSFPHASYPEWCAGAASPNITTMQTYGASDNYKLMRFGLCSTLMHDGYFSYALSSSGHARHGIFRFDEYDNAGAGRGYLGQPIGAAFATGLAWRRDFDNGIALVNPTTSAVTVHLDGTFRKIKGTQDPTVNSGKLVTSVTLQARDGIVLLKVTGVTLRASTTVLPYGESSTVFVATDPASGGVVRLEKRAAGTSAWKTSATLQLDADGTVAIARSPAVTAEYRAVLVDAGVVSGTVKIGVKPRLTLGASQTTLAAGGHVTMSGSITHSGRTQVLLQRRVGLGWTTVKRLVTTLSGRYKTTVSFARRGTFSYRVYAAADVSHLATASGAITIVVR
jgi:hypothetical protein